MASGSRDKSILIWNIESIIPGTNTTNDNDDDDDDTTKSFINIIYYFLYFITACFVYVTRRLASHTCDQGHNVTRGHGGGC